MDISRKSCIDVISESVRAKRETTKSNKPIKVLEDINKHFSGEIRKLVGLKNNEKPDL